MRKQHTGPELNSSIIAGQLFIGSCDGAEEGGASSGTAGVAIEEGGLFTLRKGVSFLRSIKLLTSPGSWNWEDPIRSPVSAMSTMENENGEPRTSSKW